MRHSWCDIRLVNIKCTGFNWYLISDGFTRVIAPAFSTTAFSAPTFSFRRACRDRQIEHSWDRIKTEQLMLSSNRRSTQGSMVKTATNPNNTYSSSDVYIIDHRLYKYMTCNCYVIWKKYNIPSRVMPDISAKQIWARDILLMTVLQKLHSWINWNLVKSSLKKFHSW